MASPDLAAQDVIDALDTRSGSAPGVRVHWMDPEGPHWVENIDERRYHAIRVELM